MDIQGGPRTPEDFMKRGERVWAKEIWAGVYIYDNSAFKTPIDNPCTRSIIRTARLIAALAGSEGPPPSPSPPPPPPAADAPESPRP